MNTVTRERRGPIRLVSSSSLRVAGFQGLFGDPCGVEIVAVSISDALGLKEEQEILIDAGASLLNGIDDLLAKFRRISPRQRLVVIGEESDDFDIEELILHGVRGYLDSSVSADEFLAALENVRDGFIWAPRRVLTRLLQRAADGPGNHSLRLVQTPKPLGTPGHGSGFGGIRFTPREAQVLRLLVGGQCNRDIGAKLGIDSGTVKAHLGRIMRKAGVGNRVELTLFALKLGQNNESKRASANFGREILHRHQC